MMTHIKNFLLEYKYKILLFVILAVGFILRFCNLMTQGFFYMDEGRYLLSASALAKLPMAIVKIIFLPTGEWSAALRTFFPAGFFEFTNARPGFIAIDVIGMWIFGQHEYVPRLISAILSTATIYIVYLIGRDNFKKIEIGLVAAAFSAFSVFYVFWSRTGESHITSAFFFTLAVYFYLKTLEQINRKKYLLLSGLAFGFLLTTHYMNILALSLASLFELILDIKRGKGAYKDFLFFLMSMLLLPFFWIGILWIKASVVNSLHLFSSYISLDYIHDFLEEYGANSDMGAASTFSLLNLGNYSAVLFKTDSLSLVILFTLAPVLIFIKKFRLNLNILYLAIISYLPIFFFAISPKSSLTYLLLTYLPGSIVLSAFLLVFIYQKFRSKIFHLLVILIITSSFIWAIDRDFGLAKMRMPHTEAANFLKGIGAKPEEVIAFMWGPYRFLLNGPVASMQPQNFLSGKYKYYISDPEDNLWEMEPEAIYANYIRHNGKFLVSFKVEYGSAFPDFLNPMWAAAGTPKEINDLRTNKLYSTIQIYDISGIDFKKVIKLK